MRGGGGGGWRRVGSCREERRRFTGERGPRIGIRSRGDGLTRRAPRRPMDQSARSPRRLRCVRTNTMPGSGSPLTRGLGAALPHCRAPRMMGLTGSARGEREMWWSDALGGWLWQTDVPARPVRGGPLEQLDGPGPGWLWLSLGGRRSRRLRWSCTLTFNATFASYHSLVQFARAGP